MRLALRLLLVALLALLLLLAALPLTATGTRWLLARVAAATPLELDYESGSLGSGLRLRSLRLALEDVDLRLQSVRLELAHGCLWRSRVCLRELQAGELSVAWPGGSWHSEALDAAVTLSGDGVEVKWLQAGPSRLGLEAQPQGPVDSEPGLPPIELPVTLRLGGVALDSLELALYGFEQRLQAVWLRGGWRGDRLRLAELGARVPELGQLRLAGELRFAGNWPLQVGLDWEAPAQLQWGVLKPQAGRLEAGGDFAAMTLQLALRGAQTLEARGEIDLLTDGLPFTLAGEAAWSGALPLAGLPGVGEDAPSITLRSPLRFEAAGTTERQSFDLSGSADGYGYEAAQLAAAGRWDGAVLVLEELLLEQAGERLSASGSVAFDPALQWEVAAESPGFTLPATAAGPGGRLRGGLRSSGAVSAEDWQLAFTDVDLAGEIGDLPARLQGSAQLRSGGLLGASSLTGEVNGAQLRLDDRRLSVTVADLQRWHPEAAGMLTLHAELDAAGEALALDAAAERVYWSGLSVARATLEGSVNPARRSMPRLSLEATDITSEQLALETLRLEGSGDTQAQQLQLELSGDIAGSLQLRGEGPWQSWHGTLQPAALQTRLGTLTSDSAVALRWTQQAQRLDIGAHCWVQQETRLCLEQGVVGPSGSLALTLAGPAGYLKPLLPPTTAVDASLEARLQAEWSPGRLEATGAASSGRAEFARRLGEGEWARAGWDRASAGFEYRDSVLSARAELLALGGEARFELRLPRERTGQRRGSLTLDGLQLDGLAAFTPELAELGGRLDGRLDLAGSAEAPTVSGAVDLSGGRLRIAGNPTVLENLALRLDVAGESARISGNGMLGGGRLDLTGELLAGDAPTLRLNAKGERHLLLLPPSLRVELSPDLELSAKPGEVLVSGSLLVHDGELEFERLPAGSVAVSDDVVVVDYRGRAKQGPRTFATGLDIALQIRDRFRITGELLNANVGGELQLQQQPGRPLQLYGNLLTTGGELRVLGQRLTVARGTIDFVGDPGRPRLNLRAERYMPVDEVTAGVAVTGPLQEPTLEIYSSPPMSQAEAVSWLTRGRGLDSGAGADSSSVAISLGISAVNRSGLMEEINRLPGLSNFEIGTAASERGTTATVSGYLGRRLYISYGTGLYEPITVITGRLYLQSRLWLEVVSALENSLDLYYSFDID